MNITIRRNVIEEISLYPGTGKIIRGMKAFKELDKGKLLGYIWEFKPSYHSCAIPATCAIKEFRDQAWGLTKGRIMIHIIWPDEKVIMALSDLPNFTKSHVWEGHPDYVTMTRDMQIKPPPQSRARWP